MKIASVVLAAGYGTRMKSDRPKVVHPVAGRPMIDWCVRTAEAVSTHRPIVVVGHGREQVEAVLADRCSYVSQESLLGTGHAVQQAMPFVDGGADAVVVTYGDMPLLRAETLAALVDFFDTTRPTIAMLTIERTDPQGFGRILRNPRGEVIAIVEEVDCTPEQLAIRELNPGIYCFDSTWLQENLPLIPLSKKGEYYLTDLVGIAVGQGRKVQSLTASADEADGVNTRIHLAHVEVAMRRRILDRHMLAGVTVIDPASTYVDDTVQIGADTTLLPGVLLQGLTQIGRNVVIGPNSQIVNSIIGDSCRVIYSVIEDARMDARSEIGPFGHLRKGAHLAEGVHMGNFGEVKNSYLGPGVKMGHFSYLGDAHVGENVNIGAGTVTCNFDGEHKHKTVIEDHVFIGSDTMLVAPVHIGAGAQTGAGAVVTRNVAPNSTVYGVPARPVGQQSGRPSVDHKE